MILETNVSIRSLTYAKIRSLFYT